MKALHADFLKHGESVLERVREKQPGTHLRVCASLIPKEVLLDVRDHRDLDDMSVAELYDIATGDKLA
jgi:hypothetical protein